MQEDDLVLSDVHLVIEKDKTGECREYQYSRDKQLELKACQTMNEKRADEEAVSMATASASSPLATAEADTHVEYPCLTVDEDDDGDLKVKRRSHALTSRHVITVEHALATPLELVGLQVWSGALFLCDYLVHVCETLRRNTVIELGAGTGLCSIVASMYAAGVICTDNNQQILELCQQNLYRNQHLRTARSFTNVQSRGTPVILVKNLDWTRDDPFDRCNTRVSDKWKWSKEDLQILSEARLVLAADVIYDNNLSDCLFLLLQRLLPGPPKRTLFLSLERRLNFTLDDLDVSCPAYDHFLQWIERLDPSFSVTQIEPTFPQCFEYERNKYLELWKITAN